MMGLGLAHTYSTNNTLLVYHSDGPGSVRTVTDANGATVGSYQNDAFGQPSQTQGPYVTQPFQFTGEQRDPTGLIYLRARYHDPAIGRFISRDPCQSPLAMRKTPQ